MNTHRFSFSLARFSAALFTVLALCAQAQSTAPALSHPLGSASSKAAPGTAAKAGSAASTKDTYREIDWDDLVPASWDPLKDFKDINLTMLNDGDPRATAMLKRMREVWDNAPVNEALDGVLVRLPGYLVPLEEGKSGMKEFLLVPYFGACIHSPPPPANQIIHVLPESAVKGFRSMDTVWVSGRLKAFRNDSFMGVSGYRLEAKVVERHVEKKTR